MIEGSSNFMQLTLPLKFFIYRLKAEATFIYATDTLLEISFCCEIISLKTTCCASSSRFLGRCRLDLIHHLSNGKVS